MTTYKTILIGSVITACMIPLSGCVSDSPAIEASADAQTVSSEQKSNGYIKPGAAVTFSHNYDGKTEPGEIESFQVFVKRKGAQGPINVKMESKGGLKVYNDTAVQKISAAQDTEDSAGHTMNVKVGAQEPGRYYLNFFASSGEGEEKMMRAYSVAIQVGDQPYVPELGKGMTAQETPEGEKIIVMDAKETTGN